MSIAEDASTPTSPGQAAGTAPSTNQTFSPPAGALIVATVGLGHAGGTPTVTVSDTSSMTWVQKQVLSVSQNWVAVYEAQVGGSAPGSITVTASDSTSQAGSIQLCCRVLTGAAAVQTGAGGGTASGTSNAPSLTFSTTQLNSWVYLSLCDNAMQSTIIPGGNVNDLANYQASGGSTIICARQTNPTSSTGSTTWGWSMGTSQTWSLAGMEILPSTVRAGGAALSGSGTLAGSGLLAVGASLSGTGTLSGAAAFQAAAAPMAGTGTMTVPGAVLGYSAVLAGAGTLAAGRTETFGPPAQLPGTGTVTATGTLTLPGGQLPGAAVLAGTGTLAGHGALGGAAALSGAGLLSPFPLLGYSAQLSGSGLLAAGTTLHLPNWTNDFEAGPAGAAVTPANSGGGRDSAFDLVTNGSNCTLTYDTTYAAHGTQSAKVTFGATAGQADYAAMSSFGVAGTVYFRLYLRFGGIPVGSPYVFDIRQAGGALCMACYIDGTGHLTVQDASASNILLKFSTPIPTGAWFRVEGAMKGDPSAGTLTMSRYDSMDSVTATEFQTATATGGGTGGYWYQASGPPGQHATLQPFNAPGYPLTEAQAAALVSPVTERIPDNATANNTPGPQNPSTVPWGPNTTNSGAWAGYLSKVTGWFVGTTDEIFQWGCYRWGLEQLYVMAEAVRESSWHQSEQGDTGDSQSILQIRAAGPDGTSPTANNRWGGYPWTHNSTPLAVDYFCAWFRAALNGHPAIASFPSTSGYAELDYYWGIVGSWYSGQFQQSSQYVTNVQNALSAQTWNSYGSISPRPAPGGGAGTINTGGPAASISFGSSLAGAVSESWWMDDVGISTAGYLGPATAAHGAGSAVLSGTGLIGESPAVSGVHVETAALSGAGVMAPTPVLTIPSGPAVIVVDPSTPAFSSAPGGPNVAAQFMAGPKTMTSPSFSPPAGSTVIVLASGTYDGTLGSWSAAGLSAADSHGNSYAVPVSQGGNGVSCAGSAIMQHYYATAPGPTTVTATLAAAQVDTFIYNGMECAVIVLTGAAASQAGAATARSQPGYNLNPQQAVITTTMAGSWVLAQYASYPNSTTAANANTTTFNAIVYDASNTTWAWGKMTYPTGTPGPVSVGWSNGSNYGIITALEILPGITTHAWPGSASLSGTGIITAKGPPRIGYAALSGTGQLSGAPAFAGAAALAGSDGVLTAAGPLPSNAGAASLSGAGTLTAARPPVTRARPVTMSGTGILAAARKGQAYAVLAGSGALAVRAATEAYALLAAGSGILAVTGVRLGFSAALAGTGALAVGQVLGVVTAGASCGIITTPQAFPGSSQVAVSPPGSGALSWLGTLGQVTALSYSFTCPGGADKMTCTVMVPASYRTQLFNPGWTVRIFRGGHQVWDGRLDEPVPTAQGWNLTAVGTGARGSDFLAVYSDTWPAGEPDEAVNNAIARGLGWANPGIGQPAGIWLGQATDSGAQTVTALLNAACTRGGLTWYVNSQPGGMPGDDLSVFPLPTMVNRLLVASTPVARTLGGDINVIYIRYQVSAASTGSGGSGSAAYGLTSVSNAASVALHGPMETYIDLSNAGTLSAAAAQAVGSQVLSIYQRASYAGPFTGHYGDLLTTGGQPVDPGTDQAGTVCQLVLSDFGYGGEVAPQNPVTFICGSYSWDDFAQAFQAAPYQTLDQSLTGLLSMESTVLTPIAAPSGTTGG